MSHRQRPLVLLVGLAEALFAAEMGKCVKATQVAIVTVNEEFYRARRKRT